MNDSKVALALDGVAPNKALHLVKELGKWLRSVKIHDLLDAWGPDFIRALKKAGAKVLWVDYKIHDTKDTVGLRVRALVKNGAKIITVHASGGVPMMKEAVKATLSESGDVLAEIYAITVLTSLSSDPNDENGDEIGRIYGKDRTREQIVHEFALMAKEAGVRTVVCSALEVRMLKQSPDLEGMRFVVPGTRSAGVALGQQKRSTTPIQAIDDGADVLVAGSQVTGDANPISAFRAIAVEINMPLD